MITFIIMLELVGIWLYLLIKHKVLNSALTLAQGLLLLAICQNIFYISNETLSFMKNELKNFSCCRVCIWER